MEEIKEKFTINITQNGVSIVDGEGKKLQLTASEALMLLDILQNEELRLKAEAEKASPLPLKIKT
ncbi:hypothetical protein ACFL9T_20565 [Thermodesulfobacteriota bacterium]